MEVKFTSLKYFLGRELHFIHSPGCSVLLLFCLYPDTYDKHYFHATSIKKLLFQSRLGELMQQVGTLRLRLGKGLSL